jgi:hypothetical protein
MRAEDFFFDLFLTLTIPKMRLSLLKQAGMDKVYVLFVFIAGSNVGSKTI